MQIEDVVNRIVKRLQRVILHVGATPSVVASNRQASESFLEKRQHGAPHLALSVAMA